MRNAKRTPSRKASPLSKARLEALIAEAVLDAYDESEQTVGFLTMIEENLRVPFDAEVLGVMVTVERIDMTLEGEIIAACRRGNLRQRISVLDLPLPSPPPEGSEWIEAYRHWKRGIK